MRLPEPGPRRDLILAGLFALSAALFRLPRLGTPPEEYFDEVYHAKTALQYLTGEAPVEWVHPPMAKLLIAVGVSLFGYQPWAWRLAPAIAGILLAPVFFFLARRVLATERAACFATVLLLADGVYLVQSRIAMTNIFAVLFQVAAAVFVVRAVLAERLAAWTFLAGGVCLGLAVSTRWTSLWAWGFLLLVFVVVRGRRALRLREAGLLVTSFVAIPLVLYVLSFAPLRIIKPDWTPGHDLPKLWQLQKDVWKYHATLDAQHPYFSKWYTWPWLYCPTWYHFKDSGQEDGTITGIVALGNPALWWASVPVTLWGLLTGLRVRRAGAATAGGAFLVATVLLAFRVWEPGRLSLPILGAAGLGALVFLLRGLEARDPRRVFAAVGFCALYLPWGISPRTLNYSHYLFEAIPYACLGLGILLDRHWNGWLDWAARGYIVFVVVLFLLFTPLLIGLPVPRQWFYYTIVDDVRPWTWMATWICCNPPNCK
jgi:dolichyl-phosphate-mannose--protein O-mannosyl transferase